MARVILLSASLMVLHLLWQTEAGGGGGGGEKVNKQDPTALVQAAVKLSQQVHSQVNVALVICRDFREG